MVFKGEVLFWMGKSISNEVKDCLPSLLLLFHGVDCALLDDPVSLAQKRLYLSIMEEVFFQQQLIQSQHWKGELTCLR